MPQVKGYDNRPLHDKTSKSPDSEVFFYVFEGPSFFIA